MDDQHLGQEHLTCTRREEVVLSSRDIYSKRGGCVQVDIKIKQMHTTEIAEVEIQPLHSHNKG
jgi:hypothetical protein